MSQQPQYGGPPPQQQYAQPPQGYGPPPGQPGYQAPPQQQPPAQYQGGGWGQPQQTQQQPAYTGPAAVAGVAGDEFDDFFSGGVKGEPAFDFGATMNAGKAMIGAEVIGTIVNMVHGQQTKFGSGEPLWFDDGSPRMQIATTLQTELRNWQGIKPDAIPKDENGQQKHPSLDTGLRRIFIRADMKKAVTEACQKAGAKPRKGGKLAVKVKGFEDTGKGNPMTLYDAAYRPPEPGSENDSFFQAPPQQHQPWNVPGLAEPSTSPVMSTASGQPIIHQQQVPPPPQQQGGQQGPPPDFAQPGYQGPPADYTQQQPPTQPSGPQYAPGQAPQF